MNANLGITASSAVTHSFTDPMLPDPPVLLQQELIFEFAKLLSGIPVSDHLEVAVALSFLRTDSA